MLRTPGPITTIFPLTSSLLGPPVRMHAPEASVSLSHMLAGHLWVSSYESLASVACRGRDTRHRGHFGLDAGGMYRL